MKITDFFSPSTPFTNPETPVCTPPIANTEQQEESTGMPLTGKSGSIKMQTPKKRRERFTDPEVQTLVDTILQHIEQLYGSKSLNVAGKAAIWDRVVREVNKAGGMKRTIGECKKRFLDYKRKVKLSIDGLKMQSSLGGPTLPLSEILTRRQMMVAEFFKMDADDGQKNEVHDESSLDKGECVSTIDHLLTPSYVIDSEEDFIPSQDKSFSSSPCLPSTSSHQDKVISQSYEEPQAASTSSDLHKTKAVDRSIPPHTATESKLQRKNQIGQLVAEQKIILESLQSLQKNFTASLNIQSKMYSLVKNSFLELQKTLLSSQKASNDHGSILELRLNSLQAKLDEMNSVLRVKQLQEIMSSDESELNASGTQEMSSTPTPTNTPSTPHSSKKNTPSRKRVSYQSPSPSKLMKKKKHF